MIQIVEFDFASKTERPVSLAEAVAATAGDRFFWVDLQPADPADLAEARSVFQALRVNEQAADEALGPDREGRYDVHDDCLHFAVSEARLEANRLAAAHMDVVLSERFLLTFHRKEMECVHQMRRTYREDFRKFARSPGFLLYEIGDRLLEVYRRSLQEFAGRVEQVQHRLFGQVDDQIFKQVSDLVVDILGFRKIIMATRELFHELASRRSPFVSETTQPYLEGMAGSLERMGSDLSTEREVLQETLNLYMGMVSHRTNKVVNRLTVISTIFLPLSFLCGVWGMNWEIMPELAWRYGYLAFWFICLGISVPALIIMRRRGWLS
jgi:magnesium transporter